MRNMRKATYEDMCQAYSDAFKAYHGVRPASWMTDGMTIDQIGEENIKLEAWVLEDRKQEIEQQNAAINRCMDAGAPDIATAMRWLEDANVHSMWA